MSNRLRFLILLCAIIPMMIAVVMLVFWFSGLDPFLNVKNIFFLMQPTTAIATLFASLALLFSIKNAKMTVIFSTFLILLVLANLVISFFQPSLLSSVVKAAFEKNVTNMPNAVSCCFLLFGTALILAQNKKISLIVFNIISLAGGLIFLTALAMFVVEIIHINIMYFFTYFGNVMDLYTAMVFILLSLGVYLNLFLLRYKKKHLPLSPSISIMSFLLVFLVIISTWLFGAYFQQSAIEEKENTFIKSLLYDLQKIVDTQNKQLLKLRMQLIKDNDFSFENIKNKLSKIERNESVKYIYVFASGKANYVFDKNKIHYAYKKSIANDKVKDNHMVFCSVFSKNKLACVIRLNVSQSIYLIQVLDLDSIIPNLLSKDFYYDMLTISLDGHVLYTLNNLQIKKPNHSHQFTLLFNNSTWNADAVMRKLSLNSEQYIQSLFLYFGLILSVFFAFLISLWQAYRAAASRKNIIMHAAGEGLLDVNIDGYIIKANSVARKLLIKKNGKLQGHHILEVLSSEHVTAEQWHKTKLYRRMRDNQNYELTNCILWPIGGGHFISGLTAVPFIDNNIVNEFTIIFRDFTKKEQQLQRDTLQLDAIVNNVIDAIITIDAKGIIRSFNKAAESIFGYKACEVVDKNINLLMPEPYHSKHNEYIKQYLLTKEKHVINKTRETTAKHKTGKVFPVEIAVTEYQVADETFFSGIVRDLTHKKEQSQKINMLTYFASSSQQGFLMLDKDLNIIYCNPFFLKLTCCFQDDVKDKNLADCYSANNFQRIKHIITNEHFQQHSWSGEIELKGKREKVISTLHTIFYVESDDEVGCIGIIITDISQQKENEYKISQAMIEADKANKAKSSFLARMSHEIRTPINGVFGAIELLHETSLDSEQNELIDTLSDSCDNLLSVINDILDFSKIESGEITLIEKENNLSKIAHSITSCLKTLALKKNINLSLYVDPKIPESLVFDSEKVKQILFNLIGNAIKFTSSDMKHKGNVEVYVEYLNDKNNKAAIQLRVRDNGIGMDDAIKKQLFKPFSQAEESANRAHTGTGLGLTICKLLIDLMKGKISFTSELGQGTEFIINLTFVCHQNNVEPIVSLNRNILLIFQKTSVPEALTRYLEDYHCKFFCHDNYQDIDKKIIALNKEGINIDFVFFEPFFRFEDIMHFINGLSDKHILNNIYYVLFGIKYLDENNHHIFGMDLYPIVQPILISILQHEYHPHNSISHYAQTALKPAISAKLLVAEDNPINQKIIQKQLDRLGYSCDIASDGLQALALWRSYKYPVILMDCHMPKMDGFELTKLIRAEEKAQDREASIILGITANVFVDKNNACIRAGMDNYLIKPFKLEALDKLLKQYLVTKSKEVSTISLDTNVLDEYYCGDMAMYVNALQAYLKMLKVIISQITQAQMVGKYSDVSELAHKIKSSSRLVGFGDIATTMENLEKRAKLRDRKETERLIIWLGEVFPQVDLCISSFIEKNKDEL